MSTPSDEDSTPGDVSSGPSVTVSGVGPVGVGEDEEEEELVVGQLQGSKKPLKGKVWKSAVSGDYVRYRSDGCGTDYCPGDAVYIDSQRPEQPYYVCAIQSLKMSKRDSLMVHVKWFYRTSEVPEQVYQLLVQDRHTEHGSQKYDVIHDPLTRKRELFISDATDIYPVSVLRGKCTVYHCSDIVSFRNFVPEKDTFFYTLSYNPETRRLASTQGEIRVGASHQAKLPEMESVSDVSLIPEPKEDPTWEPGRIHDHDLLMYLRAGRSMAAFAAMCDGGSTEDGFSTASRDSITANAIKQLHEVDYDTGEALQKLLKRPNPPDTAREWREEDIKDFIKGLRIYGKNFFKIKTEFLPQKETSDLINFYYLWKKSPGAVNNRPRGRRHRPNIVRRIKSAKATTATTKAIKDDPTDLSSASEGEDSKSGCEDSSENGEKELSPYYCRHCYSTSSRDWHHASKEKILVCRECRMYFKKYGELPTLDPRKEIQEDELLPDVLEENEGIKKEEDEEERASPPETERGGALSVPVSASTPMDETSSTSSSIVKKEEGNMDSPPSEKKDESVAETENNLMKTEGGEDNEKQASEDTAKDTDQKRLLCSFPSKGPREDLNLNAIEQDSKVPCVVPRSINSIPHSSSSSNSIMSSISSSMASSSSISSSNFYSSSSSTPCSLAPSNPPFISHSIASVLPPPPPSTSSQSSTLTPRLPHHHHPHHSPLNLHQPHLSPHHHHPLGRPALPFGSSGSHPPPPHMFPHVGSPGAAPMDMKSDLQKSLLGGMFSPGNSMRPVMPHGLPHPMAAFNPPGPYSSKDPEVQILHHSRSTPTPPAPPIHREPSPPPKPDGSECHRSQSAIFIRNWNRGEGNSCSRTDMYFKPVPESKLARKRDERLRKASNDELLSSPSAPKMSLPPGFSHVPSDPFHPPPHSVMSRVSPHPASPMATSFKLQELERYERERKEEFLRMSMGGRPPPMDPFDPRRGFNPPHSAASAMSPNSNNAQAQASEGRRLEDMARANAERQYIERITALATDPLVRLQMAGVNPEMPPGHPPGSSHLPPMTHHPGFNHLRPPPPQIPGLDPRFNPAELLGLRYPPPPGGISHPELLQRQLMLERELLAAHGAAAAQHHSLLAQQEEFLRLEQEARARQSRP